MELFGQEPDFRPDYNNQMRGLRLILEQPSRGRIFVLRSANTIIGMINLLFTISTAEGGFVILLGSQATVQTVCYSIQNRGIPILRRAGYVVQELRNHKGISPT
jgi:hypothetical protein